MKKTFWAALLMLGLLGSSIALPTTVHAVNVFQACDSNTGQNSGANGGGTDVCTDEAAHSGGNAVIDTLKVALNILALIIGIAAVAMIIIGGIKFILSNGDPAGTKSARDTVIYALVGVVVAVFARTIVAFVLNKIQ